MKPQKTYLICSVPRSGGGLLAGLLTSTGIAGRPEEYFWRNDMAGWRARWDLGAEDSYVDRALEEGATPNGLFGARLMWGYIDDVVRTLERDRGPAGDPHRLFAEVFPDVRYIHLRRLDRLAQAVSWAKATQTDEWFGGDARGSGGSPTYDRELIESLLEAIVQGERGWERFFRAGGIDPLIVSYEDLIDDPGGVTRGLLAFLGLPSDGISIEVRTRRQADPTNERWIARYRSEAARSNK